MSINYVLCGVGAEAEEMFEHPLVMCENKLRPKKCLSFDCVLCEVQAEVEETV